MRKLLLLLLVSASTVLAQSDETSRSWNQPVEPFKIIGNIFYVGASDVTSYLIATPKGHIILDGGFAETAPMIRKNIEALGFKYDEVKIILSTHAHYDHAGGLAELKATTGARFMASTGDAPLLEAGGKGDPQFGDQYPFPPIKPDETIRDLDRVALGGTILTARITPGHTKGCTTWTTTIRERGKSYNVAFLCSPSVPSSYKLVGNPEYPNAVADYRKHFSILKAMSVDVFLAAHGNFFNLTEKRGKLAEGDKDAFVDPQGYKQFVAQMEKRFEEKAREQSNE